MTEAALAREAGEEAKALFEALRKELGSGSPRKIVFAESCTGGLLSALFTELPGSSDFLWGSFVVYSVDAKVALLGLDREAIERYGVVSRETAASMARGALEASGADLAVAITGYAGPSFDPGEEGPGRVALAWAGRGASGRASGGGLEILTEERRLPGGRAEVRLAAAAAAYRGARELLKRL